MTVHQVAVEVVTFAHYLRELTALLDPGRGWYGVFSRRDPEGVRACFEGAEVPPWDVVESLLQDLAVARGTAFAEHESVRAAALYSASATAHDRRPGGRRALAQRLELMLREQAQAEQRLRTALSDAGPTPEARAQALAWARDDQERAAARCTELRSRLSAASAPEGWSRRAERDGEAPGRTAEAGAEHRAPPAPRPAPAPAAQRRKPRGARFAGLDTDDGSEPAAPSAAPVLPVPPSTATGPRGARFRGAAARNPGPAVAPPPAAVPTPAVRRAADEAVQRLVGLRAEGRSGEAHVVLCEAAAWSADHLPVLALALHGSGLSADWATLLWEVSTLPPAGLAAAAGALAAAGRAEDCAHLLRQCAARPAGEVADAVAALDRAGLAPQSRTLLDAFVRVRTPQDVARIAEHDPHRLVPHLLAAAREVSAAREWDLVHALRVAGIAGEWSGGRRTP
ncbi:hypothetical protein [Streptomyces fulvorobeus]|uniref:UL36 very large tegument protein n=1 Tax=Streptomyces fulvorobeus TaxID=284028 RepID=A0A7J0CEU9_9ACTN|nr:hypothetical protein [Streptomyces fulvorobeus]NYE43770.1 hypothetical protein [Streptomyces fulvorobeus]GFN00257.1 hypothetical protein Sfulv_50670 [Streptomyces fulvorobeus]